MFAGAFHFLNRVFLKRTPPEQGRKYLRVYSESYIKVFCSMVRDSIGSHSEFLPRALNSEFPTLEACICFWVGDTKFLITYLESWLKDVSGYIPEYFLRCSGLGSFWEELRKKGPRIINKKIDNPHAVKL